jgi:hypothetical protein
VPAEWVAAAQLEPELGAPALAAHLPAYRVHHGDGGGGSSAPVGDGGLGSGGGGGGAEGEQDARHLQRKLTALCNKRLQLELDTAIATLPTLATVRRGAVAFEAREQAQARVLSQRGKGAMAFVGAPVRPGLVMGATHLRMALRRSVGVWTTYADAHCSQHAGSPPQHPTDNITATHHAITCATSGLAKPAHDSLARCLTVAVQVAGVPLSKITREQTSCFNGPRAYEAVSAAAARGGAFIMDLVVAAGGLSAAPDTQLRDEPVLLDVTIVNPAAASYIAQGSARTAHTATAAAETTKLDKYAGTYVAATFVPFAVEAYGRYGKHAEDFVEQLVCHAVGGDERPSQAKASMYRKVHQLLSVGLQRVLSCREEEYVARMRARGVVPPDNHWQDPLWDLQLGGS